ncbi:PMR5 N-terminal domain [Macleaya cordata]|uniref:PMR5 N-terminal domain n=1 Tax=Macleaya cordata TaxID=56857 RepID=A0A200R0N7_MACCD|nr:PMR5 N-terminal domain [Macleaya cordata]
MVFVVVNPLKDLNHEKGDDDEKKCDLFKGRWIPDLKGPLYTNWSCPTLPDSKNCGKNGRKDVDYMNWRWKPDECELPRFDPKTFLSIVRGKKLAFIGDSVARNQMESLLCLLFQEQTPLDIYKDSEERFRTFYFPSHNFTLMVLWTKFLVIAEERVINGSNTGVFDIHLDKIDKNWAQKLPGLDYAIISDAHWFFRKSYLHEGGNIIGCVYCDEQNVTNLGLPFALGRAFRSALEFMNGCKDCNGLVTLLRTFSPAHFENGSWNGGGNCNRTSPYREEQINFGGSDWEVRSSQVREVERIKKRGKRKRFEVLDVTRAMMMRPDGHPGSNWNNKWMQGYNDCVHWCLPGPIDVWNDFLMAVLQSISKKSGNATNLGIPFALGRTFKSALEFINGCKDCKGLFTLLRTFSPSHFENGSWNGGGNCNRISPYREEQVNFASSEWELRSNQVKEVERINKKEAEKRGKKKRFEILDITRAMMMRPDGHPGPYWNDHEDDHVEKKCDLFKGHWIPDLRSSVYTNWSCPTMPDSKNCAKHGRKDVDYVNWRWKPDDCELPRFDPKTFLSIVRGKKLAFIGDSVARNQMESLLCLLSQEQTPQDIYKDTEDRFRTFYFPSHDFTLMVLWAKFLVIAEERVINGSNTGVFNLQLDKIDVNWAQKLPDLDYAIMSDAHWFFRKNYLYEAGKLIGCIYCNEPNISDPGIPFALGKTFRSALKYISDCKECKGLVTLLRTFSPAHFEGGTWNDGGNCNRTSPYSEEKINFAGSEWELRSKQVEEVERIKKKEKKSGKKRFEVLDITRAMMMRPDGHPGSHWNNNYMQGYNDCVHWCLPGPVDVWNDMLMAVLQKNGDSSMY